MEHTYRDEDGNVIDLPTLCRRNPEWAASRIKHMRAQLEALITNGPPPIVLADVAAAEARGAARERERCAGMVREMAQECDVAGDRAGDIGKGRSCLHPELYEGKARAWEVAGQWLRDLAERIGKGE